MIAEGQFLQDMVHPYESAPAHKINSRGASLLFPFDVVHLPTTQVCVCVCMCVRVCNLRKYFQWVSLHTPTPLLKLPVCPVRMSLSPQQAPMLATCRFCSARGAAHVVRSLGPHHHVSCKRSTLCDREREAYRHTHTALPHPTRTYTSDQQGY
jgi:hypothetical protein